MAVTQRQAVDEILDRARKAWNAGYANATGVFDVPELLYEETDRGNLPPSTPQGSPWGRVRVTHHGARQRTVSARRFEQAGSVLVECFVPEHLGDAKGKAQDLADVMVGAFEGKRTTNVEFKNVSPMEAGRMGNFYQIDVSAVFIYHRTR